MLAKVRDLRALVVLVLFEGGSENAEGRRYEFGVEGCECGLDCARHAQGVCVWIGRSCRRVSIRAYVNVDVSFATRDSTGAPERAFDAVQPPRR